MFLVHLALPLVLLAAWRLGQIRVTLDNLSIVIVWKGIDVIGISKDPQSGVTCWTSAAHPSDLPLYILYDKLISPLLFAQYIYFPFEFLKQIRSIDIHIFLKDAIFLF